MVKTGNPFLQFKAVSAKTERLVLRAIGETNE